MTDTFTREIQRQALRYAVQRAIFCPVTGEVLDMRRAVDVTVRRNGAIATTMVMAAHAWDTQGPAAMSAVSEAFPDATWEILDGRELWSKR